MIKTVTPIDNTIFVERNFASNTEVEDALENSLIARKNWSNTPLVERKNLVSKFVNSFLSNQEEVIETLCKQIGRPISQCPGEMRGFEERAKFMIDNSDKALEDVISKKDNEFDNFIKKTFEIDQSLQRGNLIEKLVGREYEFNFLPRVREDFDKIIVFSNFSDAKNLVPSIRFNYILDKQIFISSSVYGISKPILFAE